MKLYLAYTTSLATKFYLVADDSAELARVDGPDASRGRPDFWRSRTEKFASALRDILGLEGPNEPRFVLANYESDGIWCAKLFGIANDRLGEMGEAFPTKLGHGAWDKRIYREAIIVEMLEQPLIDRMLPPKDDAPRGIAEAPA